MHIYNVNIHIDNVYVQTYRSTNTQTMYVHTLISTLCIGQLMITSECEPFFTFFLDNSSKNIFFSRQKKIQPLKIEFSIDINGILT